MSTTARRPNRWTRLASAGAASLLALAAGAAAQTPQITGLSDPSLPHSGLLEIQGADFGATQGGGAVLIDGQSALVTTWTDAELHAYVPEAAGLGLAQVVVQTAAGTSNAPLLNVTPRQSEGRVDWTFEMDSVVSGSWSAAGSDGTIYTSDDKRLYALSSDGALQWVLEGAGGGMPIVFGADGTLYTGLNALWAVNPGGSVKWTFDFGPGTELIGGPGVGPDGNIYALDNSILGGHGAFSVDPAGDLRWESFGPSSTTGSFSKLVFDDDRFYAPYNSDAAGGLSLRAYDYDGDELWSAFELALAVGSVPRLDPLGQLITTWAMNGVQALTKDGDVIWKFQPDVLGGVVVPPALGSDGTIYVGSWLSGDLWAGNSDGSTNWEVQDSIPGFIGATFVSPDDSLLLDGGSDGFGSSSMLRAFSTVDGEVLWEVDFQPAGTLNQYAHWSEPGFSADGQTAYVTTRWAGNALNGLFYAIDIAHQPSGAWADLGSALAGSHGAPRASGSGTLVGGDPVSFALSAALENSVAHFVFSAGLLNAAFKGGVLVPDVTSGLVLPVPTGASGSIDVPVTWPTGLPAGLTVYMQWWVEDAGGPLGFAASNALSATTP